MIVRDCWSVLFWTERTQNRPKSKIIEIKVKCDHRSKFSNLSNWKVEAWKKSGLQRDSNPWPPRYRCDALPTELWSHTLGARPIYWVHFFPCSEIMWNIYEIIHVCTAVCTFQLLKLENLLRWSHFTFISYRSTNMNYFIYISHDFTAREEMNSINWPCSQCVAS